MQPGRGFLLAVLALLGAGIGLRLLAIVTYRPAVLGHNDSVGYLDASNLGIFRDPIRPAGYPLFLRVVRWVSDSLPFTIALQHALGLASAALLYLTVRRLGGSRWAGLLPAAVVLLGGEYLFLEHSLMSEAPFVALLCAGMYAAARALTTTSPLVWSALSVLAFTSSVTVRTAALFVVPFAVAWLALALPVPRRARLVAAGAAALVAIGVAVTYAVPQHDSSGQVGLGQAGGWSLYGRAAPFADCDRFDPPAGTEFLCEDTPPDERNGGNWYAWIESPARARFGHPPNGDEVVGEWARAAIKAQPLDYAEAVATDLVRYVAPGFNARPHSGALPEHSRFPFSDPSVVAQVAPSAAALYGPVVQEIKEGSGGLEHWSKVFALHGFVIGIFIAGGIAAVFLLSGVQRRAAILAAGAAVVMLGLPAVIAEYSHRYAVPTVPLLAIGTALLLDSGRVRRPRLLERRLAPAQPEDREEERAEHGLDAEHAKR